MPKRTFVDWLLGRKKAAPRKRRLRAPPPRKPAAEDGFVSFERALEELRMRSAELERLVSEGEIRAFRDGDSMKFRAEDVASFRRSRDETDAGRASAPERRKPFPEDDFVSFERALEELKLRGAELERLVSEGEIRAFRDGDSMKFRPEDVASLGRALLDGADVEQTSNTRENDRYIAEPDPANAERQGGAEAVCDVCSAAVEFADCYSLTTKQVVPTVEYWVAYLESLPLPKTASALGAAVGTLVAQQCSQSTGWLVCEQCSRLFEFDRVKAKEYARARKSPPDAGPIDPEEAKRPAMQAVMRSCMPTEVADEEPNAAPIAARRRMLVDHLKSQLSKADAQPQLIPSQYVRDCEQVFMGKLDDILEKLVDAELRGSVANHGYVDSATGIYMVVSILPWTVEQTIVRLTEDSTEPPFGYVSMMTELIMNSWPGGNLTHYFHAILCTGGGVLHMNTAMGDYSGDPGVEREFTQFPVDIMNSEERGLLGI